MKQRPHLQKIFFYGNDKRKHIGEEMDWGISLLFGLMRASWVLIGNSDGEDQEKVSVDESDQDEWIFHGDGIFD